MGFGFLFSEWFNIGHISHENLVRAVDGIVFLPVDDFCVYLRCGSLLGIAV